MTDRNDAIMDTIASSCTEHVIAEGYEYGGKYAWHYVGAEATREFIKSAILAALVRYENATNCDHPDSLE